MLTVFTRESEDTEKYRRETVYGFIVGPGNICIEVVQIPPEVGPGTASLWFYGPKSIRERIQNILETLEVDGGCTCFSVSSDPVLAQSIGVPDTTAIHVIIAECTGSLAQLFNL